MIDKFTLPSALTPEQAKISTRSPCSSRVCARVNLPCTAVICKGERPSMHWNNIQKEVRNAVYIKSICLH